MTPIKFRNLMLLGLALLVVACGPSKEEQQAKQIEALTAEINDLDKRKNSLETAMDSVTKEKEKMVEELSKAKGSNADLLNKLRGANAAYAQVKQQNATLQAELNKWKNRADSLAKANTALQAKVDELTAKLVDAENRIAAAEQRAAEAERKLVEANSIAAGTYYVAKVEIVGMDGGKADDKGRVKPSADQIQIDFTLGRPKGQAAKETKLKLVVTSSKGQWYAADITVTGDKASHTIDVKGKKLDLDRGKYEVKLMEGNDVKYDGFFMCSR